MGFIIVMNNNLVIICRKKIGKIYRNMLAKFKKMKIRVCSKCREGNKCHKRDLTTANFVSKPKSCCPYPDVHIANS